MSFAELVKRKQEQFKAEAETASDHRAAALAAAKARHIERKAVLEPYAFALRSALEEPGKDESFALVFGSGGVEVKISGPGEEYKGVYEDILEDGVQDICIGAEDASVVSVTTAGGKPWDEEFQFSLVVKVSEADPTVRFEMRILVDRSYSPMEAPSYEETRIPVAYGTTPDELAEMVVDRLAAYIAVCAPTIPQVAEKRGFLERLLGR
jgi:hypothetical protein